MSTDGYERLLAASLPPEPPGTPCRHCGDPVPMDGSDCPRCWTPITVPMFKAWMAELGHDTTITGGHG